MTGGVGVLVACACAAVLLLAWQHARARPSSKRADDVVRESLGPNADTVVIPAPDASPVLVASALTSYPTAPNLSDGADKASGDLAAPTAVQQIESERAVTANIVQQLAPVGERPSDVASAFGSARTNEVTDGLASEALLQAHGGDMPEVICPAEEPADTAPDVSEPVELPEAAGSARDISEAEPVRVTSATHQNEADSPPSQGEAVAGAADVNAVLEEVGSEPCDAPTDGLPSETGQADLAEADEADTPASLTNAEAAPTAREPDRDEIALGQEPVVPAAPLRRTSKPAHHRDRRGQRRSTPHAAEADESSDVERPGGAPRPPAEARLRLELHPIRRTASLSAVLTRPDGFPGTIHVGLDGEQELEAYDETRYDDLLLTWSEVLLADEIRLNSPEGFQWLRSTRRVHLFQELPEEVGLVSTGAAKAGQRHAIVCTISDADAVRATAAACGSPPLTASDGWSGVPTGWIVLSNYRPAYAPAEAVLPGLTSMDPGLATEIRLSGGLLVRSGLYAEGSPPRIEIDALPSGGLVTIDGIAAEKDADQWIAEGWLSPGQHLVDVVPGPSATYRILDDPWSAEGWEHWEAHPGRFGADGNAPWQHVEICGACLSAAGGRHVVAAPASMSVVLLGLARGVTILRPRDGVPLAMALASETPAFLISTSGSRRAQGRVEWLSPELSSARAGGIDTGWVAAVRLAAARRLPVDSLSAAAGRAWQRARERARRNRRRSRD